MTTKKKKSSALERSGQDEAGLAPAPYSPAGIRQFYQEVVVEFKKIVWPERKVTLGLSGFVVLLTLLLSIYLGTADFILGRLVSLVLQ
jgi:preprotein translocase subunit SecE